LLDLKGFEFILWIIALLFSLLFLIQTVISFIIGSGDGDLDSFDSHDHGDAASFFTLRNMIAFFTMFGWAGLAAYNSGLSNGWVVAIAVVAGASIVYLLYFIMKKAAGMRQSGTLQMKNAITQVGEVYLRIPARRGGMGKVQIQVQGRLIEADAMTDDEEDIPTGRPIKVIHTLNERILIVSSVLIPQ
jgi:membrane protein implicated in regulation of membrane protease activity